MNLLLLLPLTIPFLCLALLSLVAFLAVVSLAGALRLFGVIKSVLRQVGLALNIIRGTV